MKRPNPSRRALLAPLVHLAALVLLLEQWFWDAGMRLTARLIRWPPLRILEARVARLPPYPALCLFVVPGLLLFPVKVLAVVAIARGHALAGIATIIAAKLGSAAVVGRVYVLTLPALRSLAWFARCHNWFVATRARLVERLFASRSYRQARRLVHLTRRAIVRLVKALSPQTRGTRYTSRILRRFIVFSRARRRQSAKNEQE
jgi:hypothetical protein